MGNGQRGGDKLMESAEIIDKIEWTLVETFSPFLCMHF